MLQQADYRWSPPEQKPLSSLSREAGSAEERVVFLGWRMAIMTKYAIRGSR